MYLNSEFSNLKNILIIGGSGFIGTHLIDKLLNQNAQIINFDIVKSNKSHQNLIEIIGDIRNLQDLFNIPLIDIDIIYVLAAVHKDNIKQKDEYYDTNHRGIKNIIKYSSKINTNKIVFFSSAAVYGNSFDYVSEESTPSPENHYGKSKYLAEQELHKWQQNGIGKKLIIIRPSVVYGKGAKNNMSRMIDFISKGKFIMVGSGRNIKSICYVENLVNFTINISSEIINKNDIFNYADTPNYSIKDIVNEVLNVSKTRIITIPFFLAYVIGLFFDLLSFITRLELGFNSNRVNRFCSNTSFDVKRIEELGFKPKINLSESINRTIS